MIYRRFLTIAPVCAMLAAGAVFANDEAVLGAQAAFRAGDPDKLARHATALQGQVLEPWADYWKLRLRIEDAKGADVQQFLSRHQGTYLADLLRGDWLKELGRRGDWLGFERELGALAQDDLEVRCYAWSARLARGRKLLRVYLAQTEQKKVRFAECLRAAVEFVDGFSAQKKVEVLRELESGARDLEKMSTRDYNNHRLRKIDWLSFRADYLELNARLLAQEDIADDLASRMAIKLKIKPVEFSDPAPLFTVLPSAKWQSADNLELLGLAQELVRDESGLAIAERESRSEIELGVALGQRKGQTLVGASLEEFADNFVNLSLQWSWSALNRTADAQAQIARLEVEKTRLKQQLAQKQLEENWTEFFNGLKKNRQQLEISGKKEEIYRQQVEDAEKMYRSGKYEAEKYLDFRNRYLNEKMNNLDLTLAIWKAQIKIAELNGEHPLFCEVR